MLDMVGEVANTLSGNARKHFGSEFIISVPIAMQGQLKDVKPPSDRFLMSFLSPGMPTVRRLLFVSEVVNSALPRCIQLDETPLRGLVLQHLAL